MRREACAAAARTPSGFRDHPSGDEDRAVEPHGQAAQMIVIQARQGLIDDLAGRAQVASDQLGLGERQGAGGPSRVVGRELDHSPEQRGPPRVAAPPASTFGGPFELGGNGLVGSGRRGSEMPGPSILVGDAVAHVGEAGVDPPPIHVVGAVVDRRSDQRMPERHRAAEVYQATRLGFDGRRLVVEAQPARRPPHRDTLGRRLGCG